MKVNSQDISNELFEYARNRPKINTHCHQLPMREFQGFDLDALLRNSYINWCGIPWDAQAVSANLVLVSHGAPGYVAAAAPGSLFPQTSTVFVRPAQNRANNAILALTGNPPGVSRFVSGINGAADLVIDVNGYFR